MRRESDAWRGGVRPARLGALALLLLLGVASSAALAADPRSQDLREALAGDIPADGLAISVVLAEDTSHATRMDRRRAIARRQARVMQRMSSRQRFRLNHQYQELNGFAGIATRQVIAELAQDPEVELIYLDRKAKKTLAQGRPLVGATTAESWGIYGAGVTVAVLDTGIDTDHPHLSDDLVFERCWCRGQNGPNGCCPLGDDTETGSGSAEDDDGHGTAVSGIITSAHSTYSGVAKAAEIAALKVLDSNGVGDFSDIAMALEWVILNAAAWDIKVVNVSIGDGQEHSTASSCASGNTADAIEMLEADGIPVFVSSGNEGYDNGIAFPACNASAISVGGSYDANIGSATWCSDPGCNEILCQDNPASQDYFVCHTNSSTLLDMVAPDWKTGTANMGGGTTNFGGTSAASPYAAAMAALLYEADPNLTPADVKTHLKTGGPIVQNPDNGFFFRRARVDQALASINVYCGDGYLDPGETCDDGNTAAGDCCSPTCQIDSPGSACDDGNACTTGGTCDLAQTCGGGVAIDCDDANVCTNDSCDVGLGCVYSNAAGPCDDADACTTGDACSAGVCLPGAPLDCDDLDVCTDDACDPGTGCTHFDNSAACDDGDACSVGEICSGGICGSGAPLECDDSDRCTADACDAVSGCSHTPIEGCGSTLPPTIPGLGSVGITLLTLSLMVTAVAVCLPRVKRDQP